MFSIIKGCIAKTLKHSTVTKVKITLDIRMEKTNGIDKAQKILSDYKDPKILLLTIFHDEEYISKAITFGCKGYILKSNIATLISAINAVFAGNTIFN